MPVQLQLGGRMSGKHAKVAMTEGPLLPILVRVAVPITFANLFQAGYDNVNAFWGGPAR